MELTVFFCFTAFRKPIQLDNSRDSVSIADEIKETVAYRRRFDEEEERETSTVDRDVSEMESSWKRESLRNILLGGRGKAEISRVKLERWLIMWFSGHELHSSTKVIELLFRNDRQNDRICLITNKERFYVRLVDKIVPLTRLHNYFIDSTKIIHGNIQMRYNSVGLKFSWRFQRSVFVELLVRLGTIIIFMLHKLPCKFHRGEYAFVRAC